MIPLYLALGIAMISGISAMMKIGNNINNMIFLSTFKRDYYFKTQLPKYDKMILSILENYSNSDSKVCEHVIEKMGNNGVIYRDEGPPPSENLFFSNTCGLTNIDDDHRVLIKKEYPYKMFSCYLNDEVQDLNDEVQASFCPFEENI